MTNKQKAENLLKEAMKYLAIGKANGELNNPVDKLISGKVEQVLRQSFAVQPNQQFFNTIRLANTGNTEALQAVENSINEGGDVASVSVTPVVSTIQRSKYALTYDDFANHLKKTKLPNKTVGVDETIRTTLTHDLAAGTITVSTNEVEPVDEVPMIVRQLAELTIDEIKESDLFKEDDVFKLVKLKEWSNANIGTDFKKNASSTKVLSEFKQTLENMVRVETEEN